jgi:dTDP-D-glucose 4,6-dehydratase
MAGHRLDLLTYAGNERNHAIVAVDIQFVRGNATDTDLVDQLVGMADAAIEKRYQELGR